MTDLTDVDNHMADDSQWDDEQGLRSPYRYCDDDYDNEYLEALREDLDDDI